MRGLKRGLLGGLLLAVIVFFLPDGLLGAVTVGTGLASVLPAAAPPLGTTARLLLAVMALLIGFALTFWLVRRTRPSWDVDDSTDAEPLPAYEQMVVSPATLAPRTGAVPATPPATVRANDSDMDVRIARVEATIADVRAQISRALGSTPGGGDKEAILARVEALEVQIGDRLAAIDDRLSEGVGSGSPRQSIRGTNGIGRTLADIRRSLDGA